MQANPHLVAIFMALIHTPSELITIFKTKILLLFSPSMPHPSRRINLPMALHLLSMHLLRKRTRALPWTTLCKMSRCKSSRH